MNLQTNEIALLIEALVMAAGRHDSQARWHGTSSTARRHDETAAAMRALAKKLLKLSKQDEAA